MSRHLTHSSRPRQPSADLFVVFTTNVQTGAGDRLRRDAARIANGEEVETPEPLDLQVAEVPTATLESYRGAYELRPGSNIDLHVVDGALRANDWLLIPLSPTRFFSPQDYARIEVILDAEGKVERLDWEIDGKVYPLPRSTSGGDGEGGET